MPACWLTYKLQFLGRLTNAVTEADVIDGADPAAGAAALHEFERLAESWQLTLPEKLNLLNVNRATWYQWQQGRAVVLDPPLRLRLSYLFGIDAALQTLLPVPGRAHEWLRKPNRAPLFAGGTALARMLSGEVEDLKHVIVYLGAELHGKV